MQSLSAWLSGRRVGTLTQDEDGSMEFVYSPEYCQDQTAPPLSRMLPLQMDPFASKKSRAFFAGVLPEEGIRIRVAELLGISAGNDFGLLKRIAGDCAGAVSLLPEGSTPVDSKTLPPRQLSDVELQSILQELPKMPLMASESGIRLSLAGAQGKLPLLVKDSRIFLPRGETASTHILKPEPPRFPGLAANETYCMTLAKSVGLRVADVKHRRIGEIECLMVSRFDRNQNLDGEVTRIHLEDFCQALGYPPERKYQAEGGPTVEHCAALIWEWSTLPALDIKDFLQLLIFNTLIGNADAHGKNYSYLYPGTERRIAPAYDLVSTIAWPELTTHAAMKIGGCDSINAFGIGDWKKLAMQTESSWIQLRGWLKEISESVHDQANPVAEQLKEIQPKVITELGQSIHARAMKMLTGLNDLTV